MLRVFIFVALLMSNQTSQAVSLSLNSASSESLEVSASDSIGIINGLDLFVLNESSLDIQVASSQFAIGIVPASDAVGAVMITAVNPSSDPLFDLAPMLISSSANFLTYTVSNLPSGPVPTGALLEVDTSRGIASLDLGWSSKTLGSFQIVAKPISGLPLESSHWVDPSIPFASQPYSNAELNNSGDILLATISIISIPEPSAVILFLCASLQGLIACQRSHYYA